MAPVKLMTNILPAYYSFIEQVAKSENKTKREVIEEAMEFYIREKKRQKIRQAYKAMENDEEYLKEQVETAEWGMAYYLQDIDNAYKKV